LQSSCIGEASGGRTLIWIGLDSTSVSMFSASSFGPRRSVSELRCEVRMPVAHTDRRHRRRAHDLNPNHR
jgi:hypothetical protein